LELFKKINKVDAPPFLYTRIEQKIQDEKRHIFTKPAITAVFASLAIWVVVNIMVVGSHFRKSKTENANTFIEQMHLSSSNIYYYE
jgi:hypothetical protein